MSDQQIRIVLSAAATGFPQAAGQAEAGLRRVGAAATDTSTKLQRMVSETARSQRQLAMVGPQISDVFVSLGSGQSPLTVFLQQGFQVRDMFGGWAAGARAVGAGLMSMVTPLTVTSGAVGILAAAFVMGQAQSAEFRDAIVASGNAAGVTEGQFNAMAERIAEASGATIGSSRELLLELVRTGRVGGESLNELATAAAMISKVTGATAAELAQDMSRMSGDISGWVAEHNKAWNFVDLDLYRYIRRLEEAGDKQRAMTEVGNALIRHFGKQEENLGYLEKAWRGVANAASSAWNFMMGLGRNETLEGQLSKATKRVAELQASFDEAEKNGRLKGLIADRKTLLEQAQADLSNLRARVQLAQVAATAEQRLAEAANKGIQDAERSRRRPRTAEKPYDVLGGAMDDAVNAADRRDQAALEQRQRRFKQLQDQATDFGGQLFDQAQALNVSLITDDRQRGELQIQIERSTIQARIDEMRAAGVDVSLAQQGLNELVLARQRELNEQLKPEWQRMLDGWADTTRLMADTYDNAMSRMVAEGEQQWIRLVKDGKFSISGLVDIIIEETARLQYRQLIAPLASKGFSAVLNLAGLGSGTDPKGSSADSWESDLAGVIGEFKNAGIVAGENADAWKLITGGLGRFGGVLQTTAQALLTLAASASGSSSGGFFSGLFSLFGGGGGSGNVLLPDMSASTVGMSLAVGTNRLPADGWKYLHKDEAVVPAAFNPWAGGTGLTGPTSVSISSPVYVQGNVGSADDLARLRSELDARDAQMKAWLIDNLARSGSAAYAAARR